MDKQDVIAVLKEYIEVLEDDNVRLDNVRVGNMPAYTEVRSGTTIVEYSRTGDDFDINFDVSYIK